MLFRDRESCKGRGEETRFEKRLRRKPRHLPRQTKAPSPNARVAFPTKKKKLFFSHFFKNPLDAATTAATGSTRHRGANDRYAICDSLKSVKREWVRLCVFGEKTIFLQKSVLEKTKWTCAPSFETVQSPSRVCLKRPVVMRREALYCKSRYCRCFETSLSPKRSLVSSLSLSLKAALDTRVSSFAPSAKMCPFWRALSIVGLFG